MYLFLLSFSYEDMPSVPVSPFILFVFHSWSGNFTLKFCKFPPNSRTRIPQIPKSAGRKWEKMAALRKFNLAPIHKVLSCREKLYGSYSIYTVYDTGPSHFTMQNQTAAVEIWSSLCELSRLSPLLLQFVS